MPSSGVPPSPTRAYVRRNVEARARRKDFKLQQRTLNHLFQHLCQRNTDLADVLLKVNAINSMYSTNIFNTMPVARHIWSIPSLDKRLRNGDHALVNHLAKVRIGGKTRNLYSFASKYCSHHNQCAFPIFDRYVEKMLWYFRQRDDFYKFRKADLRNYRKFVAILTAFRSYYKLETFTLRDLDGYFWYAGKAAFQRAALLPAT